MPLTIRNILTNKELQEIDRLQQELLNTKTDGKLWCYMGSTGEIQRIIDHACERLNRMSHETKNHLEHLVHQLAQEYSFQDIDENWKSQYVDIHSQVNAILVNEENKWNTERKAVSDQ